MQRVSSAMRVGNDIWVGSNDDQASSSRFFVSTRSSDTSQLS
jgi:hypothetical protein